VTRPPDYEYQVRWWDQARQAWIPDGAQSWGLALKCKQQPADLAETILLNWADGAPGRWHVDVWLSEPGRPRGNVAATAETGRQMTRPRDG